MGKPNLNQEIGEAVNRLVDEGFVRPIVGARFPLERAAEALELIDSRGATGKVVLDVRERLTARQSAISTTPAIAAVTPMACSARQALAQQRHAEPHGDHREQRADHRHQRELAVVGGQRVEHGAAHEQQAGHGHAAAGRRVARRPPRRRARPTARAARAAPARASNSAQARPSCEAFGQRGEEDAEGHGRARGPDHARARVGIARLGARAPRGSRARGQRGAGHGEHDAHRLGGA